MNLTQVKSGDSAIVNDFDSAAGPDLITRFRVLGLVIGAQIDVERRLPFGGPMVIKVGGGAFALEPHAAKYILVRV